MKNWNESARIVGRLLQRTREGKRAALATVVRVHGSAYRREGAKLLIEEEGLLLGNVSGGCLEADLRERAGEVLRSGNPATVTYDTRDDDETLWGLGMGCEGIVDLFVQEIDPFRHVALLEHLAHCLEGHSAFCWSTWMKPGDRAGAIVVWTPGGESVSAPPGLQVVSAAGSRCAAGASGVDVFGEEEVFTECLQPPPPLLVCGGGEDAVPLVEIAAMAGFRVTVVDHRAAYLRADLFPHAATLIQCRAEDLATEVPLVEGSFVVVKMHHTGHDAGWLRRAAASPAAYIGLLGPQKRRDVLLKRLELVTDPRVFGPVGLDLGAEGSEQIALSIVAEMLAVRAARAPRHLRERAERLHPSGS